MRRDWMIKESELDDDQIKVLTATLDKSCVVSGCAGSGKSVLALIKAQRIQKERGDNYNIIVFTKALCNYMNSGREELGLRNEFVYHKEWKWKTYLKTYANGQSYRVYERDGNNQMIPYKPSADYIIVDEIQDFTKNEIKEFIDATNKHFFFFGDTAQSIYDGMLLPDGTHKKTMQVEDISRDSVFFQRNEERPKDFELYRNYRLPIPVARFVQSVGVNLPPYIESTYKSKETEMPYILKYDNVKEQIKAITDFVKNNDLTDVAILVQKNDMVKSVGDYLSELNVNFEQKYTDTANIRNNKETLNFSTSNIKVMTYASAKGLQFETVFLPMMESFDDRGNSTRKALYVAMTRTYRNLYVMYSGVLPMLVSGIPNNLYKTSITDIREI